MGLIGQKNLVYTKCILQTSKNIDESLFSVKIYYRHGYAKYYFKFDAARILSTPCNVRLSGDYWYASGSREESGVPSSIG